MKIHVLSLIACAVLISACKKDIAGPGMQLCPVGDSIRANYSGAALQLLMYRFNADSSSPGAGDAFFYQEDQDHILGLLESVYRLNIPERDTVFKLYRIQPFPLMSLKDLIVEVDPEAPEIRQLLAGNRSGNSSFDELLERYGLDSFRTMSGYPQYNYLVATSRMQLNMLQVGKELSAFPFVYMAGPNGYGGDGDRLEINYGTSSADIDFSIGRGDCPSGCTYRRHWIFRVSNCSASFVRSY